MSDCSVKEKLTAPSLFDDKPGNRSEGCVDDHVYASQEKSEGVSCANGVLKENWEIVDDGVAASELLKELRGGAEEHTTEMLGFATREESRESSISSTSGSANRVHDQSVLELNIWVSSLESRERSENVDAVFVSFILNEPARRFRQKEGSDDQNNTKDNLEGDRKSPGQVVWSIGRTIVDPIGDHSTKCNDTTLNTDK